MAASEPGILDYISRTWATLTRTHAGLASAAIDPKIKAPPGGRWPVYVPAIENLQRIQDEISRQIPPEDLPKIEVQPLPANYNQIQHHGLLYLPRPYVVPGGRFNEMYGWDSYFIQMGLLRDRQFALAKDLADNAIYEIRRYGKILNANRTYYLTRSQPPFLTAMLLAVFEHTHDRAWLEASFPAISVYHRYWTTEPHLTRQTNLSRYFDLGSGPAPEVTSSEHDRRGRTDYQLIRSHFRNRPEADYDIRPFYDAHRNELTAEFYKGDRSMRESGFDPSNRFGPFGADIVHYNPVCLNSLLYLMENQAAEILTLLNRGHESVDWAARARSRAAAINQLLWDEKLGLYLDLDFATGRLREYPFLSTFYPLWVGIASPRQAARVVENLSLFERPGGLQTSTYTSGDQWDAPFGWAPLQWIAVEGMRRYGYHAEADRVSRRFLNMVQRAYERHGTLVEKYDVVTGESDVSRDILFGYYSNEVGFGWTNAVFTSFTDSLAERSGTRLAS